MGSKKKRKAARAPQRSDSVGSSEAMSVATDDASTSAVGEARDARYVFNVSLAAVLILLSLTLVGIRILANYGEPIAAYFIREPGEVIASWAAGKNREHQLEKSFDYYRQAFRTPWESEEARDTALLETAALLIRWGHHVDAIDVLTEYHERHPADLGVLEQITGAYFELKRWQDAVEWNARWRKGAAEQGDTLSLSAGLCSMAQIGVETGQHETAMNAAGQGLALNPQSRNALVLADLWARQGGYEKALAILDDFIAREPAAGLAKEAQTLRKRLKKESAAS